MSDDKIGIKGSAQKAHGGKITEQARISEQAALDMRNGRNVPAGEMGIPMPGGIMVPLSDFMGIENLPQQNMLRFLYEPETYLVANPKKGCRYGWASANEKYGGAKTQGAIRSGRYRPLKKADIQKVNFDCYFKKHDDDKDEYVHWRDLILCEMSPEVAKEQYEAPVGRYLRMLGAVKENFVAQVQEQSKGLASGAFGSSEDSSYKRPGA
jgi:hypothetical protein